MKTRTGSSREVDDWISRNTIVIDDIYYFQTIHIFAVGLVSRWCVGC